MAPLGVVGFKSQTFHVVIGVLKLFKMHAIIPGSHIDLKLSAHTQKSKNRKYFLYPLGPLCYCSLTIYIAIRRSLAFPKDAQHSHKPPQCTLMFPNTS